MIIFFHAKSIDGKETLINWQKITFVRETEDGVELVMDNKEVFKTTNSFTAIRKLLLEHELTLDENSRIIAPNDDGSWDMIDY